MSFCCYHPLTPLSSKSQRLQLHLQCQLLADVALSYPIFLMEKFGTTFERHHISAEGSAGRKPCRSVDWKIRDRLANALLPASLEQHRAWHGDLVRCIERLKYTDIWWDVGYEMIWYDMTFNDMIMFQLLERYSESSVQHGRFTIGLTLFRKWPAAFGLCSMFCDWKSCAVILPYLWMASIKVQIGQLTHTIPIADNGQWYLMTNWNSENSCV